jgi:DnaK suppressor protein
MGTTENPSGLDRSQEEALKQRLLDTRASLIERRSSQLRDRGSLLSEVEDEGDAASRADHEDRLVTLAENEHALLGEIDHALRKFDSGEYGLDEQTGEPIGYPRLSVIPWARLAATTQERQERG